jgi:hypothetical protein
VIIPIWTKESMPLPRIKEVENKIKDRKYTKTAYFQQQLQGPRHSA